MRVEIAKALVCLDNGNEVVPFCMYVTILIKLNEPQILDDWKNRQTLDYMLEKPSFPRELFASLIAPFYTAIWRWFILSFNLL